MHELSATQHQMFLSLVASASRPMQHPYHLEAAEYSRKSNFSDDRGHPALCQRVKDTDLAGYADLATHYRYSDLLYANRLAAETGALNFPLWRRSYEVTTGSLTRPPNDLHALSGPLSLLSSKSLLATSSSADMSPASPSSSPPSPHRRASLSPDWNRAPLHTEARHLTLYEERVLQEHMALNCLAPSQALWRLYRPGPLNAPPLVNMCGPPGDMIEHYLPSPSNQRQLHGYIPRHHLYKGTYDNSWFPVGPRRTPTQPIASDPDPFTKPVFRFLKTITQS